VLIVLDRSGSMDQGGNPSKWEQAVDALDSLATACGTTCAWASPSSRHGELLGAAAAAGPGEHTASEIKQSYGTLDPGGYTPAALALQTVHSSAWLTDASDPLTAQRRKAVLFVTDGEPNCDPNASNQTTVTAAAIQMTVDAAGELRTADNALVFVVGSAAGSIPTP
jgi:Mg-chelatase subunit ChlD